MDWGKIFRVLLGLSNESVTEAEIAYLDELGQTVGTAPNIRSDIGGYLQTYSVILREQIGVSNVVEVLAVIVLAVVGLVFMWWGVRKITSVLMKAFRKGKISL